MMKRTSHMGMSDADRGLRSNCIGGSDARIIMSGDSRDIEHLWMQKRGEVESDDLSEVLVVCLGNVTEALNTDWFELQTGYTVTCEQERRTMKEWEVATCTLDGLVNDSSGPIGVFEAKFMLPFAFSLEKAIQKYYPQLQHNMLVTGYERAFLSVITGGAQWVKAEVPADVFYQAQMLEAERDFWDAVQTGRHPNAVDVEQPDVVERVRVVDMTGSNEWASHAFDLIETKDHAAKHEKTKKLIKQLFPEDAIEASGHGIKLSRSKDNKVLVKFL